MNNMGNVKVLKNHKLKIHTANGIITSLYFDEEKQNMTDEKGITGTVGYTFVDDDITNQPKQSKRCLFYDRTNNYDDVKKTDNIIVCKDSKNYIQTVYSLCDDYLKIESKCENTKISEYAMNFSFNFMGNDGGNYKYQLLPTSPYTSEDGKYLYYILTRPDGKFLVIVSNEICDGWRLFYDDAQGFLKLQIISCFDKVFNGRKEKNISLSLFLANTLDEGFNKITKILGRPLIKNIISGGFDKKAVIEVFGDADRLEITDSDKNTRTINVINKKVTVDIPNFGFYSVTPYSKDKKGLNSIVWSGIDSKKLFNKCTSAIKEPYHCDDNLCEGGCFLWSMLVNMRKNGSLKYDKIVRKELGIIMGENGTQIPRKTIVPYKTDDYAPYHIYQSGRVQEQFFGISILLEAYLLYTEQRFLDFAANALDELLDNYYKQGMIVNGSGNDYTTVCVPMIPIVDIANIIREIDNERYIRYKNCAVEIAEYLYKRGFNFPTEGYNNKYEDGSISCTSLSLLYLCANLYYDKKYVDFAKEVLELHKAWTIYTPDARMYASSFRWWETLWEGDGEGPAICAGHAWTIWKAEALYWYGILTKNEKALEMSWNGFITNLSKANKDGIMYSCYEPDFIRGGGQDDIKPTLKNLNDGLHVNSFQIAHSYPKHADNSLSRYAWVRYMYTFGNNYSIEKD